MADITNDIKKVISRQNSGFPQWLDFEKMRLESMDYLGKLSGKIWTDHNLHDPGITILETLCYAILDLGYRTSLPNTDLFARNPADTSPDNNFFTPAQILGCNPLTILDYRKLLTDIDGVKNAWLIPAEDITLDKLCGEHKVLKAPMAFKIYNPNANQPTCLSFLNGLYHIMIEPEKEDLSDPEKMALTKTIRAVLASHRNLCEDFYDISFLCTQKVGVCAEIELAEGVQPADVYPLLVQGLHEFFSPTLHYYRLRDLLDQGKPIEDIFAGRPIDLQKSHGFIDPAELENIPLRKEIHLSDLYNHLLKIKGISAAKKISIRNCDGTECLNSWVTGNAKSPWIFNLYKNHVARFHKECSGFRFTRNGNELLLDVGEANKNLPIDYSNKQLLGSQHLDLAIPNGTYRKDIASYLPLENEFPKVYGITDGSLLKDASDARKAQSLQLRGYLVFFDVLLAGYLTQLKNIRQLFSFNSGKNDHTYFANSLPESEGLKKLLDIDPDKTGTGRHLAYPVNKAWLNKLAMNGILDVCDPSSKIHPFQFRCASERDIAIRQLIEDFAAGNYTEYLLQSKQDCWTFYLQTSATQFVLLSTEQFKTEQAARLAIASLLYQLTGQKNYRPSNDFAQSRFSFQVAAVQYDYWDYLQTLTESKANYEERRNQFLDHLLARFAETFTDFALLSSFPSQSGNLPQKNIRQKENFLQSYPTLSSTRGQAYDYTVNGWNNTNVSGLQKRVAAYTGMPAAAMRNLCHFEVLEYEEQTVVHLSLGKTSFFSSDQYLESKEEGKEAVRDLLHHMSYESNYYQDNRYGKSEIGVRGSLAFYKYSTPLDEQAADLAIRQFTRLANPEPNPLDVVPSRFRHYLELRNPYTRQGWIKTDPIINRDPEINLTKELIADIGDGSQWKPDEGQIVPVSSSFMAHPDISSLLVQTENLAPYFNRVDIKEGTDIYQFTLSDKEKSYFFVSSDEYASEAACQDALTRLLFLLADPQNFSVDNFGKDIYYIQVLWQGQPVAINRVETNTSDLAQQEILRISQQFASRIFTLNERVEDDQYRYTLELGNPGGTHFRFESNAEYSSRKEAIKQAGRIAAVPQGIQFAVSKKQQLQLKIEDEVLATHWMADDDDPKALKKEAEELAELKRTLNKISLVPSARETEMMIKPAPISEQGNFGYRLVKKDGFHAWFDIDGEFADKKSKLEAIKKAYQEFSQEKPVLDICYGGNIFREITASRKGQSWYHFQIKSTAGNFILFESTMGYSTKEEAATAFSKSYAAILQLASDIHQYGTAINFEEDRVQVSDPCAQTKMVVYIPDATMRRYAYNREAAALALSQLASTYPVRSIQPADPQFKIFFPCATIEVPPSNDPCHTENKLFYYFIYPSSDGKNAGWTSSRYFLTPEEALRAFRSFLPLLRYRGNYFADYKECDARCQWRMYIREVLAVSAHRFPDRETAWGAGGVQKFITVSQSAGAFNSYVDPQLCKYTFNVACANKGLIHPCQYETSAQRDKALEKLMEAAIRWNDDLKNIKGAFWEEVTSKLEELVIYGEKKDKSPCQSIQQIVEIINQSGNQADPADETIRRFEALSAERKNAVFALVNNFPIRPQAANKKFYLEIKFQGFGITDDNRASSTLKLPLVQDGCNECSCPAWISECCFDTCEEALKYYYHILECLSDRANYLPVFDCECGPFGIRFFCDCDDKETGKIVRGQTRETGCCNEIVAVNPNVYPTPSQACDAIERAKQLINDEGLHLVEHILLRPHCRRNVTKENEGMAVADCGCLIDTCQTPEDCSFEWPVLTQDPCNKNKQYCFTPGADPYSFVATVLLPAWPERFRKPENRALLEQRIYQEAPSHIMLRILWVSPADLCEFEYLYKHWVKWIAHKPVCGKQNIPCDLIRFLFSKNSHDQKHNRKWVFDCFTGEECLPCPEDVMNENPCFTNQATVTDPNRYVNTLNRLFCWKEICPAPKQKLDLRSLSYAGAGQLTEEVISAERVVDARLNTYRHETNRIASETKNEAAAKVASFLAAPHPTVASFGNLMKELREKGKEKSAASLSQDTRKELAKHATWYLLDMTLLKEIHENNSSELGNELSKLKKSGLLPDYRSWNEKELKSLNKDLDTEKIIHLLKQLK